MHQQLSEGGTNISKKISKTKNGHINISEILQGNRQNGILNKNGSLPVDILYDVRSQNSLGMISQCSYELNNGGKANSDLQLEFDVNSGCQSRGNSIEPPKAHFDDRLVNTDIKME